jgi:hypothetical protein
MHFHEWNFPSRQIDQDTLLCIVLQGQIHRCNSRSAHVSIPNGSSKYNFLQGKRSLRDFHSSLLPLFFPEFCPTLCLLAWNRAQELWMLISVTSRQVWFIDGAGSKINREQEIKQQPSNNQVFNIKYANLMLCSLMLSGLRIAFWLQTSCLTWSYLDQVMSYLTFLEWRICGEKVFQGKSCHNQAHWIIKTRQTAFVPTPM